MNVGAKFFADYEAKHDGLTPFVDPQVSTALFIKQQRSLSNVFHACYRSVPDGITESTKLKLATTRCSVASTSHFFLTALNPFKKR